MKGVAVTGEPFILVDDVYPFEIAGLSHAVVLHEPVMSCDVTSKL